MAAKFIFLKKFNASRACDLSCCFSVSIEFETYAHHLLNLSVIFGRFYTCELMAMRVGKHLRTNSKNTP